MGWEQEKRWDWNEAETRRLVVSRDPVYKCCKGRLATHSGIVHELRSTTID